MTQTNPGFISKLSASPDARILDGTDNIHSGIINTLNIATAGNRVISGFNITQNGSGTRTTYGLIAGKIIRNGLLVSVTGTSTNITPAVGADPRDGNDWYAVFVVADGSATGESINDIKMRTGASSISTASVSTLVDGDIPIAIVKYLALSADDLATRRIQFLGYGQTTKGISILNESSGSPSETIRINPAGTITKGSATLTLPSATGTIALTSNVQYTSAIPNATSSQTGLVTQVQITKLDAIEASATADQTKSDIKLLKLLLKKNQMELLLQAKDSHLLT